MFKKLCIIIFCIVISVTCFASGKHSYKTSKIRALCAAIDHFPSKNHRNISNYKIHIDDRSTLADGWAVHFDGESAISDSFTIYVDEETGKIRVSEEQ
jgi:hypothetical protein